LADELLDPSAEPAPTSDLNKAIPQKVDYMLQGWDMIGSTSYKTLNLCLEHFSLEGETEDEIRESLRLAPQPLFGGEIRQAVIQLMLEGGLKTAARLSHPIFYQKPERTSRSVPGMQKKKSSDTSKKINRDAVQAGVQAVSD
jgi:hypothetical protein